MNFLSKLKKKDLSKETVLLRLDFNVAQFNDATRIEDAIPTLLWLINRNAKVLIVSHRGRPSGNTGEEHHDPSLTLQGVIPVLAHKLQKTITFFEKFDPKNMKELMDAGTPGSIYLLENLRFIPQEEEDDNKFAQALAGVATMYVNDAFAVSHRKHASIVGVTKYLPSYAGLQFEKEFKALTKVVEHPKHPLVCIIGGAKTSDKLPVIKNLLRSADTIMLGGGVANTALLAMGIDIKNSLAEKVLIPLIRKLMKLGNVVPPIDWVMENDRILDIGPKTIEQFQGYIKKAKMVVWAGPLGLTEEPRFARGSTAIANAIGESKAYSLIGGGETTQLIVALHLQNKISFVSTAGGAMLEFLSGKKLPGVVALNKSQPNMLI